MSWSVSASGTREEVEKKLAEDFKSPNSYLTGVEAGICGEVQSLIFSTLTGYEGSKVAVSASGHAGQNVEGKYQVLAISIGHAWNWPRLRNYLELRSLNK
jgi:hypothetical protein